MKIGWLSIPWLAGLLVVPGKAEDVFANAIEAADSRDFRFQGEYVGNVRTEDGLERVGIQVRALGGAEFELAAYEGGFPGDGWDRETEVIRVKSRREGWTVRFPHPEKPYYASLRPGSAIIHTEEGERIGYLEKTVRSSPTLGKKPPEGAVVLFDGTSTVAWRDGAQMTDDGLLKQGATTQAALGDIYLHLEFKCGYMPEHDGQGRGNSGVYIQRRYELQVLDSFGLPPARNGCAALYGDRAPHVNMSLPPLKWQTYDVWFQAPRFNENGEKIANARLTMKHNGVLVHEDVALSKGTGAGGSRPETARAPLHLQDHGGDPVRYRNIWVVEK